MNRQRSIVDRARASGRSQCAHPRATDYAKSGLFGRNAQYDQPRRGELPHHASVFFEDVWVSEANDDAEISAPYLTFGTRLV